MNRKVTVVGGAGNVGATVARAIAVKELADVVIVDIAAEKAQGIALDIFQACPIDGSDTRLIGTSRLRRHRRLRRGRHHVGRPPQARHEPRRSAAGQLQDHAGRHRAGREALAQLRDCPVANPLDAMCQAVYRLSGFPRERVVGMAGVLDSARMRTFIAMELNVSVENIHAFVLGGHGDTMVPLPRLSTVAGIPLTEIVKMGDDVAGQARRNLHPHRQRRRGDHQARRHERLVRAGRGGGGDGGGHSQGQEVDSAVLRVSQG